VRGALLPDDPGLDRATDAGIECVTGNLRDPDYCASIVTGCDAVVHLGAMLVFGKDDYNPVLLEDNLRGTFNMLQAAALRAPGLKRFVFASSDEVYPSLHATYLPIDESHPKRPCSFYGVTKLMGEELVQYFSRANHLPGAIARFALTIEPWEALEPDRPLGNFLHLQPMIGFVRSRAGDAAAAALEDRLVPGSNQLFLPRDAHGRPWVFHFCDVRDLVHGLSLLLEKPSAIGEVFNLSGPAPFSFDQLVSYVSRETGRPVVDTTVAGPPLRIQHSIAKARAMLGYAPKHDVYDTINTALVARPAG
jgi:UDP-glucose 4-epimerase